jgi:hypothetical protein
VLDHPVELISGNDESRAALHITVDIHGQYILLDNVDRPIPNFPPSDGLESVLQRLEHLAKYKMIRDLKNPNTGEAGKGEIYF